MTFDVQSNLVPDLLRLPSSFKKVPDSTEAPPTDSRRYTVAGEGLEGGPTTSFNSDYVPLRLFWPLIQSPKSKMCSCRIVPVTQFSNVRVNTTSTDGGGDLTNQSCSCESPWNPDLLRLLSVAFKWDQQTRLKKASSMLVFSVSFYSAFSHILLIYWLDSSAPLSGYSLVLLNESKTICVRM